MPDDARYEQLAKTNRERLATVQRDAVREEEAKKSGCRSHEHGAPPGTEIGQRSARGSNGDRYGKSAHKSKTEKAIQIRSLFSTLAHYPLMTIRKGRCGAVYDRTEHTARD